MAKRNKKATAPKVETIVEDVLSEEDIVAAAAAVEAADSAQEEDVEAAVAEVEVEEAKKATYKKAKSTEKPAKSAATPTKKAVPRMSLDTHKASDIITQRLGANAHAVFHLDTTQPNDEAALKASMATTLEAIDKLDKKSREKAINLFQCLAENKAPSVYTKLAWQFLNANESVSLGQLTDHFLKLGYKIGTARRQAGEMLALFPVVGVATKEKGRGTPMVLNANTVVGKRIQEILDAPKS